MRHNCLSLPVDRRFEHHFVVRVGQLRPPYEPNFRRKNAQRQFRKKAINKLQGKTMLFPLEYRLILQKQRRTRHKFNPVRGNFLEQRRSARPTVSAAPQPAPMYPTRYAFVEPNSHSSRIQLCTPVTTDWRKGGRPRTSTAHLSFPNQPEAQTQPLASAAYLHLEYSVPLTTTIGLPLLLCLTTDCTGWGIVSPM